jgi:asparagine synthase (glutamine-hydrolysing)
VHLYEEMGTGFLSNLNGWFSGVLTDLRKKRLILFNDRFGCGRIYYHEKSDGIYFASEAKSLLQVLPELRELCLESLGETVACGSVLQNRTLFRGISLIPPACAWKYAAGRNVAKHTYFDRSAWENQPVLTGGQYYERLREVFPHVVRRYFRGGTERVAMSLTGGLDCRMILAWAKRPSGSLPCYTFGSSYRECSDVKIARRIANLYGQSHHTIQVGQQFLDEFGSLAERAVYVSDGAMDVTGAVELYVNRAGREIAPVRMTGNYGSEILRGNVAFRCTVPRYEFLDPDFGQVVQAAAATYEAERAVHPVSFIAFKQVPWHHYSRLSVERSQVTVRSPYLDNDLVSVAYQAPQEHRCSTRSSLRLIAEGNPDLAKVPTDRGLRYPSLPVIGFGQHVIGEVGARAEYIYDYGMPHWLARIDKTLSPLHIERWFLGRHKFYHFRVWYRDQPTSYLTDTLLDTRARSRPHVRPGALEHMVTSHLRGTRNYTLEIHRALTIELTIRQLIERESGWSLGGS